MEGHEPSVLHPGTEIAGKYRVERRLGRGAMGVVVEATHLALRHRVAIKCLRPEMRAVHGAAERFLREARAASMLRSEHIARVFDMGTTEDGLTYMVMEYLEGEDLLERLERRGPLTTREAIGYVLQACEGLAEAHGAGLVHRDLKPSNLFRLRGPDGSELIKLLDFGLTKTASPQDSVITTLATLLGSPVYMAPEQFISAHDVDARADIWSLGVVLYELLTGAPPFAASTVPALCTAIAAEAPLPPSHLRPDLPPELDAVLLRCLRKTPAERWPDIAAFAGALSDWGPPEQRNTGARCERILKRSLLHGADSRVTGRSESLPATSYDPAMDDGDHPRVERGTSRWFVFATACVAVLLAAALVTWMSQVGSAGPTAAKAKPPARDEAGKPAGRASAVALEPPAAVSDTLAAPGPAEPLPAQTPTLPQPEPAAGSPQRSAPLEQQEGTAAQPRTLDPSPYDEPLPAPDIHGESPHP